MSQMNKILLGLLVAQVLLGLLTWTGMASKPEPTGNRPVFSFDAKKVVSLRIKAKPKSGSDKQEEEVLLARKDDGWVVADRDDYPADKDKVQKVLEQLLQLKIGDALASNPANHNALKVGERDYDREVTVKTAKQSGSVILGSGPSNSVNLRYRGKNEVYRARGLSVWTIGNTVRGYVNTKYIEADKDKLTQVVVSNDKGRLSFAKEGDKWALAELPAGETLDENKVKSFINKVSTLNLEEPVGKELKPEYGLSGGAEVFLVSGEDQGTVTRRYVIGAHQDQQSYYAKADDSDWVVTVTKWNAEDIRNKTAADFAKKSEKKE
jgi:hypothetical protein